MVTDMNESQNDNLEWKIARTIWSAGEVDIPAQMTSDDDHYLAGLKRIKAMVLTSDEVNQADRSREISPNQLADQCHSLSSALSQIDDLTLIRVIKNTTIDIEKILNETVTNLSQLEAALGKTLEPTIPRKQKHELNDMAIIELADIFELSAGSKASVTKHWEESTRGGIFVNFVLKFYELMLPDFASSVSGRSIQASLEKRSKWAASQPNGI
jgi:hypothetical protein